jgi:hypothetical protein
MPMYLCTGIKNSLAVNSMNQMIILHPLKMLLG